MSDKEQIDALANDLDALISRYEKEFELTYAAAIGVLQMKIHTLCNDAAANAEDV